MYLPRYFEETRTDVLHETMRANPFGTLVTLAAQGLDANHIPLEVDSQPAPYGTVRGHVARANPLWRDLKSTEVLAIFQGPHTYISPSWYPTAQESHKAVPTWNYVVVHAHGTIRIIDDATWVRSQLERLVTRFESSRAHPWRMTDMPADYVDSLVTGVVGFEIAVSRLIGKWKVSQNRPAADVAGIVDGLRAAGDLDMARIVAEARQDSTES
jgi:transcriptional regulator